MTNRLLVGLHILLQAISSHLFLCQQHVSDNAHFVKASLITSFPMTNRMWAILQLLWKPVSWFNNTFSSDQQAVSDIAFCVSWHVFLWPTGSEWHCTFCEREFDHIVSYDQQAVSGIVHFVKGSLITSVPITNSLWVILHIYEGSLITSFHLTNREWAILHILWQAVSSHLFLWPTACVWYCTFCDRQSHHHFSYDQQPVSDIAHFVTGSLIISFPMTNSWWVILHILWKAVSSHVFLWPTESEWHLVKGCHITCFPMINRMWVTLHICERQSGHIIFITIRLWVTLHILWKALYHLFSYN